MTLINDTELIYCIGDSHVNFFSGNNIQQNEWPIKHFDRVPIFKTYRLGPYLAYSLAKPDSIAHKKLISVLKEIPEGSWIILSFGEIDCRVHLIKQSERQRKSLEEIVNDCVDRYVSVIKEVNNRGYKIIIFHLIPSTIFNIEYQKFPTYGSCAARNRVTILFNQRLAYWARKYKFPQVSLFNKLLLPSGITDMTRYADPIHLSTSALPMIINEIDRNVPGVNKELLKKKYRLDYLEYFYYSFFRKYINYLYIMLRNL